MNDGLLLVVMSLGSYRLTRLVVTDDFPPVLWVRDRLVGGWRVATETEQKVLKESGSLSKAANGDLLRETHRAKWVPGWLASLLSCSWCASGWVSAGVVGGSAATIGVPAPALMWFAVWALSALVAAQEWS
jgi:hypothetical protein